MRLQVFGKYSYTMETIVQAGWEGLRVRGVDIEVNPKTRESRLVKSLPQYLWRSGSTIVRSFALYKAFRFFFMVGLVPFLVGAALVVRWLVLNWTSTPYASRIPSLVVASVLLLLGVQIWVLGFLADLISVSRRVSANTYIMLRRQELARAVAAESVSDAIVESGTETSRSPLSRIR
jgi:hypothetical protein